MKNIIVGTAGHVDHGKTTLIKALTGIDTDRLREEQERGMTIDLGFAVLDLPNGQRVGIVDVPGHERFIKNMLAGAGGVDVALLVIAADESVMPQTSEHLDILRLLEVERGIIALTKADMVDADWLDVVQDDIRQAMAGTFLEDAPIIPISSVTRQGLPDLLAALEDACADVEQRDASGPFRLPVDRVFTLTGFGTVVTGTLISGTMHVGDPVEVLPRGLKTRIRGLQVHGSKVDSALAGNRVAVNLAGVEVSDIARGDVCAVPDAFRAARIVDIRLSLLKSASRPLTNRSRVRLHVGTSELLGRVVLLDRDELKPGEEAFAQFRSETPLAVARGDRLVIRSYSPMITIGGGEVLDPSARRHRRFDEPTLAALETASRGAPEDLVEQVLRRSQTGATASELEKSADLSMLDVARLIDSLRASGRIVDLEGGRLMHAGTLTQHVANVRTALEQFHARNPLKPAMPREELRCTALRGFDTKLATALMNHLARAGDVRVTDVSVSLSDHTPTLNPDQQKILSVLSSGLKQAGLNPPAPEEIVRVGGLAIANMKDILELLVHQGDIVKLAEDMYLHRSAIAEAEEKLRDFIGKNGKMTVSQFRDMTGTTRKYAVPLLEYFDSKKVTRRVGDERVLARQL